MKINFIFYFLAIILSILNARSNLSQLDEFDDLELENLDYPKNSTPKRTTNKQKLILFDDNLYLLEDDFDFGTDEIELQKLELDPIDMETAREYENFLNVFFENSQSSGRSLSNQGNYQSKKKFAKSPSNPRYGRPKQGSGAASSPAPNWRNINPNKLGFRVSTILGTSIPMGGNLQGNFTPGSNFGLHLQTPYSFKIGDMDGVFGTDIFLSSMPSNDNGPAYNLTNITGTISLFFLKNESLEFKTGFGVSPSSIGDYNSMFPSIPVDLNYYFPEIKGFRIALNLHAQMSLGYPNNGTLESGSEATSEFINAGIIVRTPLTF